VAHRILTAVYYMLSRREPFHDLGATYLDERHKAKKWLRPQPKGWNASATG
jgi:hypothetical protein